MGADKKQKSLFGHPVGLYILFFTEMWERFSYYGMRGLLILYMVNYFLWSQKEASEIYKWYTSLVYLTPIVGGYLADRYLGNKKAVLIGALLMAIGHFLMAFEAYTAFYSALVFLILGNGFFKPNMSTQVGRLYAPNDPRRDGAYTIFYMGINLGAFLSPLICGWLAENTVGKYHSGFTVAGIGMVFGLTIYLIGQPWVREIDQYEDETQSKIGESTSSATPGLSKSPAVAISEDTADKSPSVAPVLNRLAPPALNVLGLLLMGIASIFLTVLGLLLMGIASIFWIPKIEVVAWDTAIIMAAGGACLLIGGWILSRVRNAVRDRVLAIYALAAFVICFWAVFEQAGNPLNIWADKVTNRYLTLEAPPPPLFPTVAEEKTQTAEVTRKPRSVWNEWAHMFELLPKKDGEKNKTIFQWIESIFNPVPTTWFQSINALAIFVLAPFFAMLWTGLAKRGRNPSVPTKMAFGVLLMSLSFAVMAAAAARENQPSSAPLPSKKLNLPVNDQGQLCHKGKDGTLEPYHAGRLLYAEGQLRLKGVLPDLERDRILRDTTPVKFRKKVNTLKEESEKAFDHETKVHLDEEPPGFDMRYTGFRKKDVEYDPATKTLSAHKALLDMDVKALLVAASDPELRDTLNKLVVESSKFRVSPWWLFWSYILATLGELCLSPVGLSMVSKLAPARFATMLMGLWLLTSFFGNYVAGAFGEIWGVVPPMPFFLISVTALAVASLVLFVMTRKIVSIMHGVN